MYIKRPRSWFFLRLLLLFQSIIFFSQKSLAFDDLVVNEVCVPRAAEIGIFFDSNAKGSPVISDVIQTRSKLKQQNFSKQTVNFPAIASAYRQTLGRMNADLKNYDSQLFQYLVNCKNDSRQCHGYFNLFLSKAMNPMPSVPKAKPNILSMEQNSNVNPLFKNNPQYLLPTFTPNQISLTNALTEDEKFRQNIFCDLQIYRLTLTKLKDSKEEKFNQCVQGPARIELDPTNEINVPQNLKSCYFQVVEDGRLFLINRKEKILDEIESLAQWSNKSGDITLAAVNSSFLPEAMLFVLRKAFEEFKEVEAGKFKSKKDELTLFYNKLDLGIQLSECCKTANLAMGENQKSAEKMREAGFSIIGRLGSRDALIFQPIDPFTKIVFEEAERQFWINRLKAPNGMYLSAKEKLDYYNYLNRNPFFLQDQVSTFTDFVKNPAIIDQTLTSDEKAKNATEWSKYQRQMNYSLSNSFDPNGVHNEKQPGTDLKVKDLNLRKKIIDEQEKIKEDKIAKKYIFDPSFNSAYTAELTKQRQISDKNELESKTQKIDVYPGMFKSLIHYQFQRVTKARVLRELQKMRYENLKHDLPFGSSAIKDPLPLDDEISFVKWVDSIMCKGMEKTYCANNDWKDFRIQKLHELYENIISEQYNLSYVDDPTILKRRYIYNQDFVDSVNPTILEINQFCYDHVNPADYKKTPNVYQDLLNPYLDQFYSIKNVKDISYHTNFSKQFEFEPGNEAQKCFTKGYLFGNLPEPSKLTWQKVMEAADKSNKSMQTAADYEELMKGVPLKDAFLASKFQVNVSRIHSIENNIEKMIDDELSTLQQAYYYENLENYESFLQDSASTRIFALLDYAMDHPSDKVGKYICHLISMSDIGQVNHQQNVELMWTLATVAVSAAPFLLVIRAAAIVYEAGIGIAITTVAGSASIYKIYHYTKKNDAIDIAGLTKNMGYDDAMLIHKVYNQQTDEARATLMLDLGIFLGFSSKAIYESRPYLAKLANGIFQATRRSRLLTITRITRSSVEELRVNLSLKTKEFLADAVKVSDKEFEEFTKILPKGSIAVEDFLNQRWPKDLGKMTAIMLFERRISQMRDEASKPQSLSVVNYPKQVLTFLGSSKVTEAEWRDFMIAFQNGPEESNQFLRSHWNKELDPFLVPSKSDFRKWIEAMQEKPFIKKIQENPKIKKLQLVPLYLKPYAYKFWNAIRSACASKLLPSQWYKWFPYKQLDNENSVIRMITASKKLEMVTGKVVFNDIDIAEYASKMEFYHLENGQFIRNIDEDMQMVYNQFKKRVFRGNVKQIDAYLKSLIGGELLKNDWILVLNTFDRELNSIDACKAFLKALKYAKKQYFTLGSQTEHFWELARIRELLGSFTYPNRTKNIYEKINEIFDAAIYVQNKNDLRLVDKFSRRLTNIEEFEKNVRVFDKDFRYSDLVDQYEEIKRQVVEFEKKYDGIYFTQDTDSKIKIISNSGKGPFLPQDPFLYEKDFLRQEMRYNQKFEEKVAKFSKTQEDPVKIYEQAWREVNELKTTEFECSLPDSIHKREIGQQYRNLMFKFSAGIGAMAYYANHSNEEKDPEWWGRFIYEMSINLAGGYMSSRIFTNPAGGPVYKNLQNLKAGWLITSVDAGIYGLINNAWNSDDKFKNEFLRIVYESENVKKSMEDFFKKNPEILAQIEKNLVKVDELMDQINVKLSKGTLVDSEIENEFKKGLFIDQTINFDVPEDKKELSKDYIINDLAQNGYVDLSLFQKTNDDGKFRDNMYESMRKIMYENNYKNKSREIDYPFLPPLVLGNWNSIEFHTGSETADRYMFYPLYDVAKSPVSYMTNQLTQKILCYGYWNMPGPGQLQVVNAVALNVIYKLIMDPLKYYLREQATGH